MMSDLVQQMKVVLASTFAMYLKSHNFHWNVEGIHFKELHDLFGGIYEEVYGSIDDFAEKIRSLGTYVPASFSRFTMLTQIEDEENMLPSEAMLQELLEDNGKMIKLLKLVFVESEKYNEYGFSDFIAGRIDAHRKHGWMLRASLKNG